MDFARFSLMILFGKSSLIPVPMSVDTEIRWSGFSVISGLEWVVLVIIVGIPLIIGFVCGSLWGRTTANRAYRRFQIREPQIIQKPSRELKNKANNLLRKLNAAEEKIKNVEAATRAAEARLDRPMVEEMEWHEIHATAIRNIRRVLDNRPVKEVDEEDWYQIVPKWVPMVCVILGIVGLAIKQFHKEKSSGFWTNWAVGLSSIGFPSGSEAIFVVYNFILTKPASFLFSECQQESWFYHQNTGAETHQVRLKRHAADAKNEGVEFTDFSARCGFCLSVQALNSIANWKKKVKKERKELSGLEKSKPELRGANIKLMAAERKLADIESITRGTEERLQGEERGSEKWMELHTQAMNNIKEVLHSPVPATTLTEYLEMGLVILAICGLALKQFKKERSDCIWTNLGVALSSIGFPSGSEAVCVIYSYVLRKKSTTLRNGAMWFFIVAFLVLSCFSSDPSDPSLDNYMSFVFGIFMTDVLVFKLGKFRNATNIASGLLLVLIVLVSVDATCVHLSQ